MVEMFYLGCNSMDILVVGGIWVKGTQGPPVLLFFITACEPIILSKV